MRRRRRFALAAGASAALCVAVVGLWVWSCRTEEWVVVRTTASAWRAVAVDRGRVYIIDVINEAPAEPAPPADRGSSAWTPRAAARTAKARGS